MDVWFDCTVVFGLKYALCMLDRIHRCPATQATGWIADYVQIE
jgi:hypothetical protein